MSADLHLDPDAVDELARLARRIAEDLDAGAPAGSDLAETLTRPALRAAAELAVFADAAHRAAGLARDADRRAADGFRDRR